MKRAYRFTGRDFLHVFCITCKQDWRWGTRDVSCIIGQIKESLCYKSVVSNNVVAARRKTQNRKGTSAADG